MKPSEAFRLHREEIRRVVERNNAANPRIFGSVIRGEATGDGDLDILVGHISGRTTLISPVKIERETEGLIGVIADVLTRCCTVAILRPSA